jgi:hypothetical protein
LSQRDVQDVLSIWNVMTEDLFQMVNQIQTMATVTGKIAKVQVF